jgi:PTS system beta-glucosides-specific IIC component
VVLANYENFGYDSIQAFCAIAVVAQMAAAFAVGFKSRNTRMKTTGFSAALTGFFGITEPAIYGVTLRLKKPFVCGCIGGAIGAAVASLFNTYYYAYAGLAGILTVVNAISPDNPSSFIGALAGTGVAIVATTVLVYVIGFEDPVEADDKETKGSAQPDAAPVMKKAATLVSPLKGSVVPLETVNDESFSQKLLGDGVAIKPTEGIVRAPCDATISSVIETKHAVGMTCDNGAEVLIHVGLDTVKLKGKYFESLVGLDQKVKAGDPLIQFDLESIAASGYDTTTPFIVMNSDEYSFEILNQEARDEQIEIGQPVIQMA